MEITLGEPETRICAWLAKQRHAANRQAAVADAQVGPQSSEMTDLEGIGGEFAFCKLFNLYPDMTIGARAGGADAHIGTLSVDVKTTKYPTGRLLATLNKSEATCDIYALVVGQMPNYCIRGWAYGRDLTNECNLTDLGYGKVYAMMQHELRPLSELEAIAAMHCDTMNQP